MTELHPNDPQEAREFFSRKLSYSIGPAEVKALLDQDTDFALIDVRAAEDYAKEHVPGALNLPEGRWKSLAGLEKNKVNVVYCYNQQCHLAARAAFQFAGAGYQVMELEGGFKTWKEQSLPVEGGAEEEARKTA
jgi:rhodanese-related sulfurtransferase